MKHLYEKPLCTFRGMYSTWIWYRIYYRFEHGLILRSMKHFDIVYIVTETDRAIRLLSTYYIKMIYVHHKQFYSHCYNSRVIVINQFWKWVIDLYLCLWASCQIRKIAGAHAPGMPGTFSPSPHVSDPDMHHGTCVTHVPWCMPGSLTSGFIWNWRRGKTFPAFPAHAQPAILRIWKEAHGKTTRYSNYIYLWTCIMLLHSTKVYMPSLVAANLPFPDKMILLFFIYRQTYSISAALST